METLLDFFSRYPPGVWVVVSLALAVLVFWWLNRDINIRQEREDTRKERMARLKQEAIEKLRAEKDGR